ncbi:MAG: hypothetical protein QGI78_01335 [Phycisphaerales bacterium]|jgi:4-diphosphocytidyl-2-C-methyl-D-erythritol kinase|nr:hypothetical protein [Phycisphaerales bacterium]
MRQTLKRSAHAKINLSLSVGAPLESRNMLHPIASWMSTIDLCDEITVTRLDEGDLSRYAIVWHEEALQTTPIDWPITSDLAVRAHRFLEAEVGHTLPVQLKLEKRIPLGAGLGGGSSDAAAMLQAVAVLFDLDVDLHKIAASLGSDVTFLLTGGSSIVGGVGDELSGFDPPDLPIVLVIPPYGCATGEVYDAFDELQQGKLDLDRVCRGEFFNDLTLAATEVATCLAKDMERIETLVKEKVHLSGSGSSMFVICDTTTHAETLAQMIQETTGLVAIATHTSIPKKELEITE